MSVDVLNESDVDVDIVELTALCRFVMKRMRLHPETEMSLRLVDIPTITELNEKWMGKEGPTDVLSFPMDELLPGKDGEDLPEGYLGDIALSPEIADQQAPGLGRTRDDEIRLLTVHGILHLLGYDHAEPEEHEVMFGIQGRLLVDWEEEKKDAT
ncbi:MAG: rRNA maturation RNase YbeY [Aeromicrobium sp.]|nr:MAG: rRNA maturation RNase YbeY [Aeromicrobium sp.]